MSLTLHIVARTFFTAVCIVAVSGAIPSSAFAADAQPPHGPPPEAIAACNGKSAGVQVSFTGHHGETMTGVCELVDGVLAARPSGMPPGGGKPPQR